MHCLTLQPSTASPPLPPLHCLPSTALCLHQQEALDFISQAVVSEEIAVLEASVCCNRAAVNLHKGNFAAVLEDCQRAIVCNKSMIKAYWRAAKASHALGKYDDAISYCDWGLSKDADSKPLKKALKEANKALAARTKRQEDARRRKEEREAAREKVRAELIERGVQMGPPLYDLSAQDGIGEPAPKLDAESGLLTWPVVFLYSEHGQTDVISEFSEANSLSDHLEVMFPPQGSSPSWDPQGVYTRDSIEAFFELRCVEPFDLSVEWPEAKYVPEDVKLSKQVGLRVVKTNENEGY